MMGHFRYAHSFPLRKNCEALLEYHVPGIERSKSIDLEKKNIFIPREEFKTTSRLTHARYYEMLYKNDSVIVKDDGE